MNVQTLTTDILILGAGGAGLFAALHAKKANPELDVTIAVKGLLGKCGCTRMVQGGYNVALSPEDSVERNFMDTIEGGGWLNDQDLAWLLVETAPKRIRELETELGCFFDRNPDGTVHQKAFAGQTFDRTGRAGPRLLPCGSPASPAPRDRRSPQSRTWAAPSSARRSMSRTSCTRARN